MKQVMATAVAWALLILPTASVARDNLVWFPSTTTTGCIYYRTAFAANVARQKTKMKRAVWTGTPCQPGKPINGEGTLEEAIADGGHPDGWQRRSTGRFVDGVPHGPIALSDTFNRQPQMRVYDRGCDDNALCVKRDLPSLAASAPAISAPQARTPPASSAGLTSQQIAACSAEIKRVQVESQSWSGGVAAVSLRLGRIQKGLFTGACAGHPEARAYLAGAERMIADGSAAAGQAQASPAPRTQQTQQAAAHGPASSRLPSSTRDLGDHSRCLEPHHPTGGASSYFQNTCGYKVWFYYCVYGAKRDASADCQKPRGPGFDGVGSYTRQIAPIHGGTQVYWLACRDPARPTGVVFELGRGLVGRCQ